ncbi:hypothetical protein LWI29_034309 [Acer saccharum]|uniref:Uncharacterized protein n=1 Tax=Acer saccharum TaxID=4024 RepID=A0AA39T8Q0_ACESA|nr:hypothetical protein LWI29_034309 [Acer saccharum]
MEIKGCCQNMVPSIDETGLNELKRLSLNYFDELECIIDTTQQQDVAFSNLVDLSLDTVGLREICSGGRPPRGFLENLETLEVLFCHSMSSLFPSWVLIQRLRKLKKVTVRLCKELEDVFQLEGLSYAKENPFLLSSLESLHLSLLHNLRYIWKGPTQQVSLQSLTVVNVYFCSKLRYLFTLSLARSLLQLEELTVRYCDSLEHIVEIKEAEENVGGGGGNDVMFPKLRILKLKELKNFINFYSENPSVNMQTAKEQLRDVYLLRHGLQNLEVLMIGRCKAKVLFQLEGVEQELSFPSLKVLELRYLEGLECLCKGPTHLLSLPNLKRLSVKYCCRLRHMFSPSLARNLLQLEELIIEDCWGLEYIVSIKAEENVGGGGGNDVMLPKLRILKLDGVENFSLGVQNTKKQLRGLRHGLQNLEKLYIIRCRVQVLFHLEGLEQELSFPSLKVLKLKYLKELECLCKGPAHLLSLPNLKKLKVDSCSRLRHMFSPSLARNFMQLEELIIQDCKELEQIIVEEHIEDDHVQLGLFPNLSSITVTRCGKLKSLFPVSMAHLLSLQNLTTLKLDDCHGLTHLFSSTTLVRNLLQLKTIDIKDCWELEQIIVEEHIEDDHVQLGLFPNLFSITVTGCGKLQSLFPVSMAHLLSLPNLTTLKLDDCHGLTHLFLSTLARNLLQLESIHIWNCGELEQIIVEDHTENDHVQLGLFPNLSSISVKWCDKLKTLFPAVTIARSGLQKLNNLEVWNCKELEQIIVEDHTEDDHVQLGLFPNLSFISINGCGKLKTLFPTVTIKSLQKLKRIYIGRSFQLEELFGHKDEADMTSHREIVLPQLQKLNLEELASLVNFCPIGYHFIFPSLSKLVVTKCPKLTTRFSVDQNRSVHAEAKLNEGNLAEKDEPSHDSEDWGNYILAENTTIDVIASINFEKDWIIDSDCGHHLTRDKSNCSSFKKYIGNHAIVTTNNLVYHMEKGGSVVFSDGGDSEITISSMYHVPKVKKNLFSAANVVDFRSYLLFRPKGVKFL